MNQLVVATDWISSKLTVKFRENDKGFLFLIQQRPWMKVKVIPIDIKMQNLVVPIILITYAKFVSNWSVSVWMQANVNILRK